MQLHPYNVLYLDITISIIFDNKSVTVENRTRICATIQIEKNFKDNILNLRHKAENHLKYV